MFLCIIEKIQLKSPWNSCPLSQLRNYSQKGVFQKEGSGKQFLAQLAECCRIDTEMGGLAVGTWEILNVFYLSLYHLCMCHSDMIREGVLFRKVGEMSPSHFPTAFQIQSPPLECLDSWGVSDLSVASPASCFPVPWWSLCLHPMWLWSYERTTSHTMCSVCVLNFIA